MQTLYYAAIVLALSVSACKTAKPAAVPTPPEPPQAEAPRQQQQILFVTLRSAPGKGMASTAFNLVSASKKEGKLKKNSGHVPHPAFVAYYTNANGMPLDSASFEDPLKQKTEYADENGKIAVLDIDKNPQVVLRVNYQNEMKKIRITDKQTQKIISEIDL